MTLPSVEEVKAAVKSAGGVDKAHKKFFSNLSQKTVRDLCAEYGVTYAGVLKEDVPDVTVAAKPPDQVVVKPTYRISQNGGGSDKIERVLGLGDLHDSPKIPDKKRFYHIGRYAAEYRIPRIVSIGDILTFDSLCRYERNDTLRGKSKPSFIDDMDSGEEAMSALEDGLGDWMPKKEATLGNHDDRIFSFTNNHPEIAGMMERNLHTLLTDKGWSYSPFGALHYIGGVAFTHVPLNSMGKPYGGMYAENQIARDSITDIVYGHSHKRVERPYWKLGGQKITILNLGCALPPGHVEEYAKHSLADGNWDYGIYDITIQHGHIQKAHWIPMLELEERYG